MPCRWGIGVERAALAQGARRGQVTCLLTEPMRMRWRRVGDAVFEAGHAETAPIQQLVAMDDAGDQSGCIGAVIMREQRVELRRRGG